MINKSIGVKFKDLKKMKKKLPSDIYTQYLEDCIKILYSYIEALEGIKFK